MDETYFDDEDETDTEQDTKSLAKKSQSLFDPKVVTLETFVRVSEMDDDRATTTSDLKILNNNLAIADAILPAANTIEKFCLLANTMCKHIEARRKVKKLSYGQTSTSSAMDLETIED